MKISIENTEINGVKVISYDAHVDKRGEIWTTFIEEKFNKLNLNNFNHDKFSISYKDVIRGIH